MEKSRARYAKKRAIENFNQINNSLVENFRLTIPGDGKYQIIEELIKQTVDIAIEIYKNGKL